MMPIRPSKTKRGTTLCIMLLHMGTGSVWNWWVLRQFGGLLTADICVRICCYYYELPWWLLFEFFGYSQICENLQYGAVNSNICNQLYHKNMLILIIQSLFNKLVLKCCLWVEFTCAQIIFNCDQNIPGVCVSSKR